MNSLGVWANLCLPDSDADDFMDAIDELAEQAGP